MMERYNPFSATNISGDSPAFSSNFGSSLSSSVSNVASTGVSIDGSAMGSLFKDGRRDDRREKSQENERSPKKTDRYSTSFPDPLGDLMAEDSRMTSSGKSSNVIGSRHANVNFAPPSSRSIDEAASLGGSSGLDRKGSSSRQASSNPGGFTSFLSRATSVTSSSVTDRVSGAMGSMKSAVDTLSNQLQQAVPTNLNINERLSSTASNLIGSSDQLQQQLASKFSSATAQFTSSNSNQNSGPVISRQRVILIIDNPAEVDWIQQFSNFHRLTTASSQSSQSVLSSLFTSATAQLGSLSSGTNDAGDLVEQADSKNISILANQSSATAMVCIIPSATGSKMDRSSQLQSARIVRPEYVVMRQKSCLGNSNHLAGVVKGLNYSLIPMFESSDIWSTFQDRQQIFTRLAKVQRTLGKENFPLIPQIYCQTHQDLLNYVQSSTIKLPCLVRLGAQGSAKIMVESVQTLKDLASILKSVSLSCTIEPYLTVKYDLIVQKLGNNLKLYKRLAIANKQRLSMDSASKLDSPFEVDSRMGLGLSHQNVIARQELQREPSPSKLSLGSRQSSMVGSSVFSGLISGNQQLERRESASNPLTLYERMTDVNSRYRALLDAINKEFEGKLEAFSLKLVVTNKDREYVTGLDDCCMRFVGNSVNQEEDKRALVELIFNHMNSVLPKHNMQPSGLIRGDMTDGDSVTRLEPSSQASSIFREPRKFVSQSQVDSDPHKVDSPIRNTDSGKSSRSQARLNNRSQSVSMNQTEYGFSQPNLVSNAPLSRRSSDRIDRPMRGLTGDATLYGMDASEADASDLYSRSDLSSPGMNPRQSSLSQSLFDQTSNAFSSLQRQSMSFFKRLDSRIGNESMINTTNTPPQSAKSDRGFIGERGAFIGGAITPLGSQGGISSRDLPLSGTRGDFKSQSVDADTGLVGGSRLLGRSRGVPQKPPPPQIPLRSSRFNQSASDRQRASSGVDTPNSTPTQTRQNSLALSTDALDSDQTRNRVIRQNSAISAFEPFDNELSKDTAIFADNSTKAVDRSTGSCADANGSPDWQSFKAQEAGNRCSSGGQKASSFHSGSITSADSVSTTDTVGTNGDDTMKNLKKTFASIFGEKPPD